MSKGSQVKIYQGLNMSDQDFRKKCEGKRLRGSLQSHNNRRASKFANAANFVSPR